MGRFNLQHLDIRDLHKATQYHLHASAGEADNLII